MSGGPISSSRGEFIELSREIGYAEPNCDTVVANLPEPEDFVPSRLGKVTRAKRVLTEHFLATLAIISQYLRWLAFVARAKNGRTERVRNSIVGQNEITQMENCSPLFVLASHELNDAKTRKILVRFFFLQRILILLGLDFVDPLELRARH
jgi:hypothetical protein